MDKIWINIKRMFNTKIFSESINKFMSIRIKIVLLACGAMLPMIGYCISSPAIYSNMFNKYFSRQNRIVQINDITKKSEEITVIIRNYISDPYNKSYLEAYMKNRAHIRSSIKKLSKNKNDDTNKETDSYLSSLNSFFQICEKVVRMAVKDDVNARSTFVKIQYKYDILLIVSNDLIAKEIDIGMKIKDKGYKDITIMLYISAIALPIIIGYFMLKLINVLRRITKTLDSLINVSEHVSKGNYDLARIDYTVSDEVGVLASTFNGMILNLKTANEEIRVKQDKLELLYLELMDSNSELKKANDELKITQKKLVQSEKMASLGSLVAGIAHEINTPMGVSILANSLLIEKADSVNKALSESKLRKSDINEFIDSVYECNEIIHRNLEKISDLLTSFKQISVNNMYSERKVFSLEKCIKDIVVSLKSKLQNIKV